MIDELVHICDDGVKAQLTEDLGTVPRDMGFNADGTEMYATISTWDANEEEPIITKHTYTLTTPFDLRTRSIGPSEQIYPKPTHLVKKKKVIDYVYICPVTGESFKAMKSATQSALIAMGVEHFNDRDHALDVSVFLTNPDYTKKIIDLLTALHEHEA